MTIKQAKKRLWDYSLKNGVFCFATLQEACATCAIEGNKIAASALKAMGKVPFDETASDESIIALAEIVKETDEDNTNQGEHNG